MCGVSSRQDSQSSAASVLVESVESCSSTHDSVVSVVPTDSTDASEEIQEHITSETGSITANRLQDMFMWPKHNISALARLGAGVLDRLADTFQSLTVTSSFSGIDGPGVADLNIVAALSNALGRPVPPPVHVSATEWDVACQHELKQHPSRPQCIFGNQEDFWVEPVRAQLDLLRSGKHMVCLRSLLPIVHSGKAVKASSYCYIHRRECVARRGVLNRSGIPCVNFSPIGKREGTDGSTMTAMAAWAAQRRVLQEPDE